MSRILGYTLAWRGHVEPIIGTLRALRERGNDVALALHPKGHDMADATGIRVRAAELDFVEQLVHPSLRPGEHDGRHRIRALRELGEPSARDLDQLLQLERPDALLVDPIAWGAMVSAEASGLPWAAAAHTCAVIPTMHARPLGRALPPPRGFRERLAHWFIGVHMSLERDRVALPIINGLRRQYGLPVLRHARHCYFQAPLTLAFTAEPFEYPRDDWHPSVRFVGPSSCEPDHDRTLPVEVLERLRSRNRPLVVVTTSSSLQEDYTLVDVALAALATEDVHVIATVPVGPLPDCVPANAYVSRYLPHGPLLKDAACVICHGGLGIAQKALAAGVPLVVVPFGRDQFEVAQRIRVAQAGIVLPVAMLSPEWLRQAVAAASSCRPGAQRIASAFHRTDGVGTAAREIENLVNGPMPRARAR